MTGEKVSCDVLVVGGGVSGTAAALAAARGGARVILSEKERFLGGVGYSGLFQYMCGLYLNGDAFPAETLNTGIVREIVGLFKKVSPQRTIIKIGQVYVLPYSRDDLRAVLTTLCHNESTLTVLHNTTAVSVEKENGIIMQVTVNRSGTVHHIYPQVVIDCSGSGALSAMAGASFALSPSEKLQLAGFVIHVKGMSEQEDMLSMKVPYYLAEGVRKKILPPYMRYSAFSPGDEPDEGYCKISIEGPDSIEREQRARKDAARVHGYLMSTIPSFKTSYIADSSQYVMDRESRRVIGEYTLNAEDVLNAGKFHDGIVKNAWPIEIWDKEKGTVYQYIQAGDYYEIPLRCLKVKDITNLLCAGRCISVSREALGSTRVMGTCIALGDHAGRTAASMVMDQNYLKHASGTS
ncbi:MAG: FAD-dependent oxidoreductase [Thermodesulfovibrionales bacterium]